MADWLQYVRDHLDLPDVRPEWESEVVEELARQLEDAERDAIARGETHGDAAAFAAQHIPDWQDLRRSLIASRRGKLPFPDRWQDQAAGTATKQQRR